MGFLEGKVAIVTGGGKGMGRGIALTLAAEGASLMLMGRTAAKLEETRSEIEGRGGRALTLAGDVKDPDAIERCVAQTVSELGTVDILINNAQEIILGPLLEVSEEDNQAGWESGPIATWRLMIACHPHLVGDGAIVNVGSRAGTMENQSGLGLYGAHKQATRAITRAASWEWASDGIRVNAILPFARTSTADRFPEPFKKAEAQNPLGRAGDPEADIGPAVAFLVGPAAAYITGVTLPIDGGNAFLG